MSSAPATRLVVSGTLTIDTTERVGRVLGDIPGGSALYAASAASLLLPCTLVGIVGRDFPFTALGDVWQRGVDPSAIEVRDGPTFRWHARYDPGGGERVTLSRHPGVAGGRLPPMPALDGERYALQLGSTDPRIQAAVQREYNRAALVGLDSMTHWWTERGADVRALLRQVDVVFLSEDELSVATGGEAPHDAVRLLDGGPSVVVVKRGARGAWMQRRGQDPLQVPAYPSTNVIDTTGAGDAFAGAFLAALATSPDHGDADALRFATAVASFTVEGIGITRLATATLAEVAERARNLQVTAG